MPRTNKQTKNYLCLCPDNIYRTAYTYVSSHKDNASPRGYVRLRCGSFVVTISGNVRRSGKTYVFEPYGKNAHYMKERVA